MACRQDDGTGVAHGALAVKQALIAHRSEERRDEPSKGSQAEGGGRHSAGGNKLRQQTRGLLERRSAEKQSRLGLTSNFEELSPTLPLAS